MEVIMKSLYIIFIIVLVSSSIGYSQRDTVFTTVSGDSVTIWNVDLEENCASRFSFSIVMLDSNIIVLTETDTVGPIALCVCTFDISATLVRLGIGHYTVDVFRQYLTQYFYPKDTIVYIESTSFDIFDTTTQIYTQGFQQSSCGGFDAVVEDRKMPSGFSLDINYPNPFNPTTTIKYQLPVRSHVMLSVFDLLGREVARLLDEVEEPGDKIVTFDGKGLASGVYYYRLEADGYTKSKKLLLLK